jgi:hypothetical protein
VSLTVLHLRWDVSGDEAYDALLRALPEDDRRPPACLSRRHVRHPRAVMVHEVRDDAGAAREEPARVREVLGAGADQPYRVASSVPEYSTAGFGRRPRPGTAADPARAAVPAAVPAPREPEPAPVAAPAS